MKAWLWSFYMTDEFTLPQAQCQSFVILIPPISLSHDGSPTISYINELPETQRGAVAHLETQLIVGGVEI